MSSNVQSIVCCLGDPVAGNPTQFLMQRAAAAQSLDWMFVTAEVPGEKIVEAFQGIRALRFSGVAFLPPHRLAGCNLVDSMTESAHRSGHVRVARRDGDVWLGDDTLGAAIVELLNTHFKHSGKFATSHLDSKAMTADSDAILVSGRRWLAHLIRLAMPSSWNGRIRELVEQPNSDDTNPPIQSDTILGDSVLIDTQLSLGKCASIPELTFESALELETPIETLIVDSTAVCPPQKLLSKLRWSQNPTIIFVESNTRWESSFEALNIPDARLLRSIDVSAAKALVNFNFWTGHQTDIAVIRESLDEYCQW